MRKDSILPSPGSELKSSDPPTVLPTVKLWVSVQNTQILLSAGQETLCCCCWVASVVSDSVRPQRQQPTRLPCPWDSPGKNTGVGCHFLLQCRKVKSESEVTQSCWLLATPWTAACKAPPSMGFSRQEYWSGVPLPSPYIYTHNMSKSLCHTPGKNNYIINQLGFNFFKGKKSMKVNTELPCDPAIPVLSVCPK